jgi:hypothetical protein
VEYEMFAKFGRHRRSAIIFVHCGDCAAETALELAKAYAKGKGTYGPLAWTYGQLTIQSYTTEPIVIRGERPYLRLVD